MRERGLKPKVETTPDNGAPSLPVRERGLKRLEVYKCPADYWSLPVRERGLKRQGQKLSDAEPCVAPRAGAWIETPAW